MRLLHGHIFKNGGTTFEGILTHTFGTEHFIVQEEDRMRREASDYLDMLIQTQSFRALSTHFLPVQDALKDPDNLVVVFLRNPIERALSVYEFEKKQDHNTLGAINAKKMTAREYFEWRLSSDSPATIRDFQTRYLLQFNSNSAPESKDAILLIDRAPNLFVGIVERFHDSILELKRLLEEKGIVLLDTYERRNENRKTLSWSSEQKNDYLKELIGDSLYQRLLELNLRDSELYEEILRVKTV